jgi:hypothetical protein
LTDLVSSRARAWVWQGLTALWRGVMPTIFRNGSNSAFNFGAMGLLSQYWLRKDVADGQSVPVWKTSVAGLISASIGVRPGPRVCLCVCLCVCVYMRAPSWDLTDAVCPVLPPLHLCTDSPC